MTSASRSAAWLGAAALFLVDLLLLYGPAVWTTGTWIGEDVNVITEHAQAGVAAHYALVALGLALVGASAGFLTRLEIMVIGGMPLVVYVGLYAVEASLDAETAHSLLGIEVFIVAVATAPQGIGAILGRIVRDRQRRASARDAGEVEAGVER